MIHSHEKTKFTFSVQQIVGKYPKYWDPNLEWREVSPKLYCKKKKKNSLIWCINWPIGVTKFAKLINLVLQIPFIGIVTWGWMRNDIMMVDVSESQIMALRDKQIFEFVVEIGLVNDFNENRHFWQKNRIYSFQTNLATMNLNFNFWI